MAKYYDPVNDSNGAGDVLAEGGRRMTTVGDERRIQHLKATVSAAEKSAIYHAATLWQAMHRVTDEINSSTLGSVLAAIASEWVATAVDSMQPQDD